MAARPRPARLGCVTQASATWSCDLGQHDPGRVTQANATWPCDPSQRDLGHAARVDKLGPRAALGMVVNKLEPRVALGWQLVVVAFEIGTIRGDVVEDMVVNFMFVS